MLRVHTHVDLLLWLPWRAALLGTDPSSCG